MHGSGTRGGHQAVDEGHLAVMTGGATRKEMPVSARRGPDSRARRSLRWGAERTSRSRGVVGSGPASLGDGGRPGRTSMCAN
jgi:hypothetical protein